MTAPSVYDHVRPVDSDHRDGTYRVVGSGEGAVTLLRVADADGRRINTGELVTVGNDEFAGFDPAENPDGNRSPGAVVRSTLEAGYWSIRVFVRQLIARPLATAVAATLVLVGSFGAGVVAVPEVVLDGLVLVGSLGLAYVGSGRP